MSRLPRQVHFKSPALPFISDVTGMRLEDGVVPDASYWRSHGASSFCNSGTEAVMVALRLARTATGRSKVAIFAGSYHGASDSILATQSSDGSLQSLLMPPGVTQGMVDDILVLNYGSALS